MQTYAEIIYYNLDSVRNPDHPKNQWIGSLSEKTSVKNFM